MTLHRLIRAAWLVAALLFVGAVARELAVRPWSTFWQQTGGTA